MGKINVFCIVNTFLFFLLIKIIFSSTCSKSSPFYKNNQCISFCSKEELNSNDCIIAEETVKIQYMTNLVIIGSKDYRYINIDSDENNNMVIQTSKYKGTPDRLFYGIKFNGRFLFQDSQNKEIPYIYYNITGEGGLNQRYEGESSFIKLCNPSSLDEKDYFLSISSDHYTELFDFQNKVYTKRHSKSIFEDGIYSDRNSLIRLTNQNNIDYNYYYLFAFSSSEDNEEYECNIYTYYFSSTTLTDLEEDKEKEIDCLENKMISCFETEGGKIICFYRDLNSNSPYYYICVCTCCFSNCNKYPISQSESSNTFYKGIHLKIEIGAFIYFKDETSTSNPYISFFNFPSNSNKENYNSFENIILSIENGFHSYYMLNDIVKVTNTKICYISPNLNKKELNVVILSLFNDDKNINIRYYIQPIYEQNHYMIYKELRLSLYNKQYITLGCSVCNSLNCEQDNDEHYASFLIFSYPNSTDIDFDLVNELYKTNEEITRLNFNLEEYTKIENNLFGFIFQGIKIIKTPENIELISTKTNLPIISNYTMSQNENFTLKFSTNNAYIKNNYTIEYALVITEGDYNDINEFTYKKEKEGIEDGEEIYGGEEYIGRTSYYKILIKEELTTLNCNNDNEDICSLCVDNNYCVTCKYGAKFEGNIKTCKEKEITSPNSSILTTIPSTILPMILSTPNSFSTSLLNENIISTIPDNNSLISYSTPFTSNVNFLSSTILSTNSNFQKVSSETSLNSPSTNPISLNECSKEQILNNKCNEGKMTDQQIEDIHTNLKDNLNQFNNTNNIIETKNVIFQISTLEQQKNNLFSNISSIDLGECENKIKNSIEGLSEKDELIIIKTDIKDDETKSTFVQYEVYNPHTYDEIDLKICENEISISVPVYLDNNIKEMNEKLNQNGFNIFDKNDSFYNDICTKYTTENGTDITLTDRRNDIYGLVNNISLCQKGCNFEYYNSTTKKAKCNCNVQEKENFISDLKDIKNNFKKEDIVDIFSKGIMNSNVLVLKCYKLALCFMDHIYNYGCIIMSVLFILFVILVIKYWTNDRKIINNYIRTIINQCFPSSVHKKNYSKNVKSTLKSKYKKPKNKKSKKKKRKKLTTKNEDNNIEIYEGSNYGKDSAKNIIYQPPKKFINQNTVLPQRNNNDSKSKLEGKSLTINNLIINKNINPQIIIPQKTEVNPKNKTTKISRKKVLNYKKNKISQKTLIYKDFSTDSKINNDITLQNKYKILNDQELNTLEYNLAINLDKRTYFEYYFSLLKKKHLIFFAFIPSNDYNIMSIKICFFIISFSLYFSINGFFFTDDTMHDIYASNGSFSIFNQLSKILYSSLISLVIQYILKLLCLSENNLLNIKRENNFELVMKKSKTIKNCLLIKFIIFYILGFCLMIFCWYFITCFCAVYHNTQIILIKDTFISFAISMIYPFGINLLPGIFRIPALKDPKKNKRCIYKVGLFVALF